MDRAAKRRGNQLRAVLFLLTVAAHQPVQYAARVQPLVSLEHDGLATPEVGEWAEEKYQVVRCYEQIFARSMKNRWQCRVCIDLFAGAGRARLRDSKRIVNASPMLALEIEDPFDKFIFCELDTVNLDALRQRAHRDHPNSVVDFLPGDSNANANAILGLIPQHSRDFKVLTFCFVDPLKVANLRFSTIEQLASGGRRIDFLVLIPSGMEAQRFWERETGSYGDFLGNPHWRKEWKRQRLEKRRFAAFFVDEFATSMKRIGYEWHGLASTRVIRNEKTPIYHLAFFSRHPKGAEFWAICNEATTPQRKLF